MAHNNYWYTFFGPDQYASMAGWGYGLWRESTDGLLRIACKNSTEQCTECDENLSKPSYVTAPNFPHASHQEIRTVIKTRASDTGLSNGWCDPNGGA